MRSQESTELSIQKYGWWDDIIEVMAFGFSREETEGGNIDGRRDYVALTSRWR